jgi:phosphate transport system substrate-binding protein
MKSVMAGSVLSASLLLAGLAQPASAEHPGLEGTVNIDPRVAKYAPEGQVKGSLSVEGSDTMHTLMSRLAAEFHSRQADVKISVKGGGSSQALKEFVKPVQFPKRIYATEEERTRALFIASSREMTESEIKQFTAEHGYEPTAVPVAIDAVALYVNKDNPVAGLTLDQVDAMFSTSRNRGAKAGITQWGQVGLTGTWEHAPIALYGRNKKSGTREFFKEHALAGGEFNPSLDEEPGSASVILAVSRDRLGIGYSGIGWQASSVRVVPLAEGDGVPFIQPTAESVANQTYPLRRVLYLYVDKAPKAPLPPAAQEFLAFINSREGQEAVVKAGFFPLPAAQVEKSIVALKNFIPR